MSANTENFYEVLSPWAEADPVAYRGISPRVGDPNGKAIGLLCNSKRVAPPTLKAVESRLKKQYPKASISWFYNTVPNETMDQQPRKGEFEEWLKGVDVIIAAYGD